MAIDQYNGVRSTIIDQINQVFQTPPTANAVLVIGTSRKGAKEQLVRLQDGTIVDNFGSVPSDGSFDTNLVRAYFEASRSTGNGIDAFGLRVGDAEKAILLQYESQGIGGTAYGGLASGDYGYTQDATSNTLSLSLIHEANVEGDEANGGRVEVIDEDGVPKAISFETPDGIRKSFALDPYGRSPNALANVREIAQTFNADPDWRKWYTTKYVVLRKEALAVTVQQDANGGIYVEIDGGTESYGDKLETLEKVEIQDNAATDDIPLGRTAFALSSIPTKDALDVTATIDTFVRTVENEQILSIDATNVGNQTYNTTLFLGRSNARWDSDLAYVWNTSEASDYYDNFTLYIAKPDGSRVEVPKLYNALAVYYVTSTGQIFIDLSVWGNTSFQLGDIFVATYSYKAFFSEANLRSQLEIGNEFSYFVKGNEIIFGASLSLPLTVIYSTKKVYAASDINLSDAQNIVIYFLNPLNRPTVGAQVLVTYTYLPELPASSGTILTLPDADQLVQQTGFSGGTDGRNVGKLRYKQLVEEALDLVELYPFKQVLIAGAYIDDVVNGYDDETGLAAIVPVNWGDMLVAKIATRSFLVKECTCTLAVRPPNDFTPKGIRAWFDRLLINDAADPGRGANQIDAMQGPDSFRFNVVAGAPIVAISQVAGGIQYVANPAAVYTGMRQDLPIEQSHTNALLPPNVFDLGVKVLNAKIVGDMNQKKYTFMTVDAAGNRIIADAPTVALTGSNYDRQFVVDATFAAVEIIRVTAQRFIGIARTQENILALRNKCQKTVQYLVPKVFQNIQVSVLDVPEGSITGRVKLGISMITSREIRRIDLETRISLV